MRQLNHTSGSYVAPSNSNVTLLSNAMIEQLATDLNLEIVTCSDEGTVTPHSNSSYATNKSEIKALKYHDDLLFFICRTASYYWEIVLLDGDFNYINYLQINGDSTLDYIYYTRNEHTILFRASQLVDVDDYSVAITMARDILGEFHPVGIYRTNTQSTSQYAYIRGKNISDTNYTTYTTGTSYLTLISLVKLVFPNDQLVCDYVYVPTHIGSDFSPKRLLLNNEQWVYTGSYSQTYPGNGMFIKFDEYSPDVQL